MRAKTTVAIPMTAPLDAEGDVTVRRFYWLRRLGVLAVVGAVAIVASWVGWQRRAEHRLDAEVAQWRQAGLRIDLGRFAVTPVPDDQNAAVMLAAAADACPDDPDLRELLYKTDANRLTAAEARGVLSSPPFLRAAEALRLFHAAVTRPAAYWQPAGRRTPDPWLGNDTRAEADLRELEQLVDVHAGLSASTGDEAGFLQDMTDLHAVRRLIAGESTRSLLARAWSLDWTVANSVAGRARSLKLSGPHADELRRRAMTLVAEMARQPDPLADATVHFEFAAANAAERVRSGSGFLRDDREPAGRWGRAVARVVRPANERLAAEVLAGWRAHLVLLRAEGFGAIAQLGPLRPPRWRALGAEPAESVIAGVWAGDVDMMPWVDQLYSVGTIERLATVGLACRLYALDHGGSMPTSLSQLVPGYLKALPLDPYARDGGAIRYAAPAQGVPAFVYSVGQRGRDLVKVGRAGPLRDGRVDTRSANPALPVEPSP